MLTFLRRAALAVLLTATSVVTTQTAFAAIKDYEFQLVQSEVKRGNATDIVVRLINKSTNKPVPDAVIFAKRLDMAPDGMPTMDTPLEAMPGGEPGSYRFKAALPMAGNWQLSLSTKVQGEADTLQSKLALKVVP